MRGRSKLAEWATAAPQSLGAQIAVVVVLALIVALRWWPHAVAVLPLNDELPYMRAIDLVISGESPYRGGYLYPPLFAVGGAWLVERIGSTPFLFLVRALCYLGLAATAWIALRTVSWRKWFPLAAVLGLCLLPAIAFGVTIHNISLAISGATLVALWIWPRQPVLAGLLLGVSAVVKPMVLLVPVLLLVHRSKTGGHRHRVAGGIGLAVTGLLLVLPPYLPEMMALASRTATIPRSVSLHRLSYLAGWENGTLWVSGAVALVTVLLVRRLELNRLELLVVASVGSLMATPVLWSHTLVMTLPIQVLLIDRLVSRPRNDGSRFPFEAAFVLLTVAALQLSTGASSVDDQPVAFQVASTLPIALAPALAALYLMRTGGVVDPSARA